MDLGVLERSPEAGDVDAVDGLVAGYVARADRFARRAVSVRAAGDGLVAASAGEWAAALGERSARLAAGLDDAAVGCRDVAGVLAGYGEALRGLRRRVMSARHEVGTARIRAVAAQERYAAAALAGGAGGVPWSWAEPPAVAAVAEAADELRVWRAAVEDAAAGLRAFRACCDEREDLDRATAARLVGIDVIAAYAPGTQVDAVIDVPLVQALTSAAAGTVTVDQAGVVAAWFADAAMAVGDDPLDGEAVRLLSGFLDDYCSDPEVAAVVFAALGGERTVRLIAALGTAVRFGNHAGNATLVHLGREVRAALADGSQLWSRRQAEAFADGMFGLVGSDNRLHVVISDAGTASAIGYLFADADGARMSAAFTVAVADRLDAWEQEHGRLPQGAHQFGYWLASAEAPGSDLLHVLDPAAAVFATLGTYPQEARDWLTGGSVDWASDAPAFDPARISYWFGERDWSTQVSDGFGGIGGLWAGVQGPDATLDARQVAAINDLAFARLSRNASLLVTENISDTGALQFARVIEAQLPGLVEVGVVRGPAFDDVSWELVPTAVQSSAGVAAAVDRAEFAQVLAAATSQPAGHLRVGEAFLAYEAAALNAATAGEASPSLVLNHLAVVWGVADGAIDGALQAEHQRASDQVRGAIGLARVPVNLALAHVPNPVVAIGLDAAVGHLEKLAVERLTPGQAVPVLIRDSDVPPVQQYFTHASATFRSAGLWDDPMLRSDADVLATAATDGAVLQQVYEDAAGNIRAEIANPAPPAEESES